MARSATGAVLERRGKRGVTFALRFRAYGRRRYLTLGGPAEGWTRELAEEELANVLADVRRGIWRDEAEVVDEGTKGSAVPTFADFAAGWLAEREAEPIRERTKEHHRWAVRHLTDWLGRYRLDEIGPSEVDAFKLGKLAEGQLGANSVNRCVRELEYVLDYAADLRLIETNPASGKRRRVKGTKPRQTWFYPEQLPALLTAAKGRYGGRGRPLVALLAGAGLRISEALALEWRHVNLARGELVVKTSKTEAGERTVVLTPALVEELSEWKARARFAEPTTYVFATAAGNRDSRSNVCRRLLRPVVEAANVELVKKGMAPIEDLTLHGLRHGYVMLQEALGVTASETAGQVGHKSVGVTMNVYLHASRHRSRLTQAERAAFAEAVEWGSMGTSAQSPGFELVATPEGAAAEAA